MANINYQNPTEKQKLSKRAEILKKFAPILRDRLSGFEVKAVCLDNGHEIQNIKIELNKNHSSDEDIVEIKNIIIKTGKFNIFPKLEENCLLVSVNFENIDLFGRSPTKDVVVPLTEKKVPVGLERDSTIKQLSDISPRLPIQTVVKKTTTVKEEFKNEKVSSAETSSLDSFDVCERVRVTLKAWGFKAPKHYISVAPNKIGATINCTSEGIEGIKEKFLSTYPDKVCSKDGKKTVKIREDFDTDTSLPKEPTIKKANSWAEKFIDSEEEEALINSNGNQNGDSEKDSHHINVFEPFSPTNLSEHTQQKTEIQTIQNKEEMKKQMQKEILEQGKEFLRSLGITWGVTGFRPRTGTMAINIIDGDGKAVKAIEKQAKAGVELKGKAVHFNEDFSFTEKSSGKDTTGKKTQGPKKKAPAKNDYKDKLESLFEEIRNLKRGPDFSKASERFEEVFPSQTLWLSDGESSKKISIEVLLKKVFK